MIRKILVLLAQYLFIITQSQILAIDYGTQFIKAALVNAGAGKAFSIVENPKSQRKFINSVKISWFRWEFIMKKDFTRPIHFPRDREVLPTVSSTLDYSWIFIITLLNYKESRKILYWNILTILKVISF